MKAMNSEEIKNITFWKSEDKEKIDHKLFSETAERLAYTLNEDIKHKKEHNKRTQIRKFYDEVVRLDSAAKARQSDWDAILPQVHMMTAKAAYARGRELVSDNFLNFIKSSVNQIQETKDLNVFSTFFEAMMGFYRLHGPRN